MTGTDEHRGVAVELAAEEPRILEGLNSIYEDSTLLVARILGDRRDATSARATAVGVDGVRLVVVDDDGEHRLELAFANPISAIDSIWAELFGLVIHAREQSGEDGVTSAEKVIADATGYRTFFTTVTAVTDVGPNLRQVTFAGGDLSDGFAPVGPDTFLYLLLPPPGRTEMTIDSSFTWEGVREMPVEDQPVGAYYTLRRWRPDVAELDIWMVLHDGGQACAWAVDVEPGRPAALWGPRTAWAPPADTERYVLVADDTGLPAVEVILEALPPGPSVEAIIEVDGPDHERDLPTNDGVVVTWLHRNGAEPGTTSLLVDAVTALPPSSDATYVWGGAESRAMTAVRRKVRGEWGLARHQVSLVGYWRHKIHADDPVDPEEG